MSDNADDATAMVESSQSGSTLKATAGRPDLELLTLQHCPFIEPSLSHRQDYRVN
jgi:hypothetical protein